MAIETIKALVVIGMFGVLEAVLHFPRIGKLHHALQPVRVRRRLRRR